MYNVPENKFVLSKGREQVSATNCLYKAVQGESQRKKSELGYGPAGRQEKNLLEKCL